MCLGPSGAFCNFKVCLDSRLKYPGSRVGKWRYSTRLLNRLGADFSCSDPEGKHLFHRIGRRGRDMVTLARQNNKTRLAQFHVKGFDDASWVEGWATHRGSCFCLRFVLALLDVRVSRKRAALKPKPSAPNPQPGEGGRPLAGCTPAETEVGTQAACNSRVD